MLTRPIFLVPLGLIAAVVSCQSPPPETAVPWEDHEAAIRGSVSAFEQAVRGSDWASAAEIYSQDAAIMVPNQLPVMGREGWSNWVASLGITVSEYHIEIEDIYGGSDLAFVAGTYSETLLMEGDPEPVSDNGKYVQIWRRGPDGEWEITHDIWNSNEPIPEMAG